MVGSPRLLKKSRKARPYQGLPLMLQNAYELLPSSRIGMSMKELGRRVTFF
jgi:hypothetical protein